MKKIIKILLFLIMLFSISIGLYYVYKYIVAANSDDENEVKIIKKIDNYGYTLKENATTLYKEEFDELSKILSKKTVSYEDYAKSVSKLFVIDFYTLDNKLSKNDIGGIEFIHPDIVDNFVEHARSTIYKYVKLNDGNKANDYPEVSDIKEIEIIETTFTFKENKETVPAYKVNVIWDYKEDLGYESEAAIILVKVDNKLYIVEMN